MKITINNSLCKSPMMKKDMKFAAALIHSVCKETRPSLRELASDFKISKSTAQKYITEMERLIDEGLIRGVNWQEKPKTAKPKEKPKPIAERQKEFYKTLVPFLGTYGKETLRQFYDYWSESDNKKNPKMKCETQETWETAKRLARWHSTEKKREPNMEVGRILQGTADWETEKNNITNTKTGW